MSKPKTPKQATPEEVSDADMHAFIATVPGPIVNAAGLINGMSTAEIYARLKAVTAA